MKPNQKDEIYIDIICSTAFLGENEANIFLDQLSALIAIICENPLQNWLKSVSMLREETLSIIYPSPRYVSHGKNLLHLKFEEAVSQYKSSTALYYINANGQVTLWDYSQLSLYSNRISCHIQNIMPDLLNFGDQANIVVCLPKSPGLYASILGILNIGAAYCPLDPETTPERKRRILENIGCQLILTNEELQKDLKDFVPSTIKYLNIEEVIKLSTGCYSKVLTTNMSSQRNAYVLFTSGTTGAPKGVPISHESVCQVIDSLTSLIPAASYGQTRFLQYASPTFDVSVFDIFWTFLNGHCLCSAPKSSLYEELPFIISLAKPTHLDLTPTVAGTIYPIQCPSVEVLFCIGEPMTDHVKNQWADKVLLLNAYGPTECTVACTLKQITKKDASSCIGSLFPTAGAVVLSPNTNTLAPRQAMGELAIFGPQVMSGYLGSGISALSPFISLDAVGRCYRTGDLVRLVKDGNFQYLGRLDEQIKVNGHRVELMEINAICTSAARNIAQVVTVFTTNRYDTKSKVLIAFVKFADFANKEVKVVQAVSVEVSRIINIYNECNLKLPSYMVPSLVIPVNLIPLQSSGKVDKPKLTQLYHDLPTEIIQTYYYQQITENDPLNESEKTVQAIVTKFLTNGEVDIGLHVSLFSVGLDSLKCVRLSAELQQFGFAIHATDILKHPTVSYISRQIAKETKNVKKDNLLLNFDLIVQELEYLGFDRENIEDIYYCTPMQNSMIAGSQKCMYFYNNYALYSLRPEVSYEELSTGIIAIIMSNAIFRTKFILLDNCDGFLQAVHKKPFDTSLAYERSENVEVSVKQIYENFVLEHVRLGPHISFTYLMTDMNSYLLICAHHAIFDGHSLQLLINDISTYINSEQVPNRVPYKKYIDAIMENIGRDFYRSAKDFFSRMLDSYNFLKFPALQLPLYQRKNEVSRLHCARSISKTPSIMIDQYAREYEVSLSVIGLASWAKLLSLYLDRADVCFGTVLSGRNTLKSLDYMGPCLVTMPVRVQLNSEDTIRNCLKQILRQQIDIYEHQFTPLSEIMRTRDAGAELFDTVFTFQNNNIHTENEYITLIKDLGETEMYRHVDNSVFFQITVLTNIICLEHCQLIADQMASIFDYILIHPDDLINHIYLPVGCKLLSEKLDVQLYNDDKFTLMHQPVEYWAAKNPEFVAIEFAYEIQNEFIRTQKLTYYELNLNANKISSYLLGKGAAAGSCIAICMKNSLSMYATFLAVSKIGSYYVATDYEWPLGRKIAVIKESNSKLTVCDSESYHSLSNAKTRGVLLNIEADWPEITTYVSNTIVADVSPNDVAYCIFTSGTSGRPKGVLVEHHSLIQFLLHLLSTTPIPHPPCRFLQFASPAFDVHILECHYAWMSGGIVVAAPKNLLLEDLTLAIRSLNVSHADITPAILRILAKTDLPNLDIIFTGGDAVPKSVLEKWAGHGLIQAYGPSEVTIGCTMNHNMATDDDPSNIGSPFPNVSAAVISTTDYYKCVLIGTPGELVLGGPLVARGYTDLKLSAEKFCSIPWMSSSKVYRSGDLVRQLADGSYQFLGRIDKQIKLNGIRIELEEISSIICKSDSRIRLAFTTTFQDKDEKRQIISFISLIEYTNKSGDGVIPYSHALDQILGVVFNKLKCTLPSYMIPMHLIPLFEIPLSTNGKYNEKQLEIYYRNLDSLTWKFISRSTQNLSDHEWTDAELRVRNILANFTNTPEFTIARDTSIFALGIDSIRSLRLAKVLTKKGIHVTASSLMKHATICEIAICHESGTNPNNYNTSILPDYLSKYRGTVAAMLSIDKSDIDEIYPCTPLQQGIIANYLRSKGRAYMTQFRLRVDSSVDIGLFESAIQKTISYYKIFRSAFVITAHNVFQVVLSARVVTPNVHERYIDFEESLKQPLISYEIQKIQAHTYVVLNIFHALFDRESIDMFFTDVELVYQGEVLCRDTSVRKIISVNMSIDRESAKIFWIEQLLDYTPLSVYDIFGSRGAHIFSATKNIDHLSELSCNYIQQQCRKNSVTIHTTIQTALALILSRYSGRSDIVIGVTLSGRSVSDLLDLAAPTFSTMPFRFLFNSDSTIGYILAFAQKLNSAILPFEQCGLSEINQWIGNVDRLFDILYIHQMPNSDKLTRFWKLEQSAMDTEFPLTVETELDQSRNSLTFRLNFKGDLMKIEDAKTLLLDLDQTLRVCLSNSNRLISSFIPHVSLHNPPATSPNVTLNTIDKSIQNMLHLEAESEVELLIQTCLADLLNIKANVISRNTDFFSIGLDSVLAIQFLGILRNRSMTVSYYDIFKFSTPHLLAQRNKLDKNNLPQASHMTFNIDYSGLLSYIPKDHVEKLLPCTALQEAILMQNIDSDGKLLFNHAYYEFKDCVKFDDFEAAWRKLINDNEVLRIRFSEYQLPGFNFVQAVIKKKYYQPVIKKASEGTRNEMTLFESHQHRIGHLDADAIQKTPLMLTLYKSQSRGYFVISILHALYDGISWNLMLKDLNMLYGKIEVLRRPQFSRFVTAYFEQQLCSSDECCNFWKFYLKDASRLTLQVTTNKPLHVSPHPVHNEHSFKSSVSTSLILDVARQLKITSQAMAQTALAIMLWKIADSNCADFIVGNVLSCRHLHLQKVNCNEIIGPIFNTIPFRLVFSDEQPVQYYAKAMHANNVRLLNYQQTPLRKISKWMSNDERLFDILFIYQGKSDENPNEYAWRYLKGQAIAEYPLSVEFFEDDNNMRISLSSNTSCMPLQNIAELLNMALSCVVKNYESILNHDRVDIGVYLVDFIENTPLNMDDTWHEEASIVEELEHTIRNAISKVLGIHIDQVDKDTRVQEYGFDSISVIHLSSLLKSQGCPVLGAHILRFPTARLLARFVNSQEYRANARIKQVEQNFSDFAEKIGKDPDEIDCVMPAIPVQIYFINSWLRSLRTKFLGTFVWTCNRVENFTAFKAWEMVSARYSILRTAFAFSNNQLYQIVLRRPLINWNERYVAVNSSFEQINAIIDEHIEATSFDLNNPPYTITFITFQNKSVFVITAHHVLYDAWSLQMLLHEFEKAIKSAGPSWESTYIDFRSFVQSYDSQRENILSFWATERRTILPQLYPNNNLEKIAELFPAVCSTKLTPFVSTQNAGFNLEHFLIAVWAHVQSQLIDSNFATFGVYHSGRSSIMQDAEKVFGPTLNIVPLTVFKRKMVAETARCVADIISKRTEYEQISLNDFKQIFETEQPIFNVTVNVFRRQDKKLDFFEEIKVPSNPRYLRSLLPSRKSLEGPSNNDIDIEFGIGLDTIDIGVFGHLSRPQVTNFIGEIKKSIDLAFPSTSSTLS